mmetsp:Transcript_46714/g.70540  ORF Transcript_46714/g.70540 Transcript_46714/m.70540 type:complete len:135 (-) Transcript_46714:2384-2788(-)
MKNLNETVQVTVTAIDNGWTMGEELVFKNINSHITLADLAEKISRTKCIPINRMKFKLPPSKSIPRERWDKSISHFDIRDGTLLLVLEPTLSGCWQWHTIDYLIPIIVNRVPLPTTRECRFKDQKKRPITYIKM